MSKPAKKEPTISPKQFRFVAEYLVDQNGTQAAIRAGYSPRTANEQASDLLAKPSIRAEVDKRLNEIMERSIASRERILQETTRLALSDPKELVDENGRIRRLREIPDDLRVCIKSIKRSKDGAFEVTFRDKEKGLELMGKYHKLWTDRVEHDVSDNLIEKMRAARKRVGL